MEGEFHWTQRRSLLAAWSSKYSLEEKFSSLVDVLACSRPVPYECVITPRLPEVESILAEERERLGIQI